MSLGDNIKNARIKKGLTQEALAELISNEDMTFGNTAISNWEKGTSKPDADTIFLLCKALDVDANYLLGWKEIKAAVNLKDRLKKAMQENDFFDNDDLTEENFDKLMKFIEKNKEFIIDKNK